VVSKPQIRSKGKAQADRESAAYIRGMGAFIGGPQHRHWALDGVLKPLLMLTAPYPRVKKASIGFFKWNEKRFDFEIGFPY
jgi:hypothetical protein